MNRITTLLMVAATYLLGSCANQGHDDAHTETDTTHTHADEIVLTQTQASQAGVKTERIAPAPFSPAILVSGQIAASQGHEQTIAATSSGIVSYVNGSVAEGMAIGRGQTIATVSARNLQDGDPLAKARAAYEAAKSEYERTQGLAAKQIVSQKELVQAKMLYETARIAYQAQAKSSTAAGIAVASPIGGYVKTLLATQGQYVSLGQPIAVVTDNRRMQLRADVPCQELPTLRTIGSARFRRAGSDRIYSLDRMHGRLVAQGRSVAQGSAFVPVTFEFDNIGDIVSGAYAEVWLLAREQTHAIALPTQALTEEMGDTYVYVKTGADTYVRRRVVTGATDGLRTEIKSGLKAGEQVVCQGAHTVRMAAMSKSIPSHHH